MKILNISNSHGIDSVWLLPEVLRAERPTEKFLVAELYQPYALTEHIQAARDNEKKYHYYTNSGKGWCIAEGFSIKMALKAERWDVVMFNESSRHLGLEEKMSQGMVTWFLNYILENLDYRPKILYNMTWANPTDDRFYTDEDRQRPTATFKSGYANSYGYDHVHHYHQLVKMTKKYIVGQKDIDRIIYGAKPIQYAGEILGVPQYDPEQKLDLYRDYTHLSDFACLMVAYQWYCQMFCISQLTEVKVDAIQAACRVSQNRRKMGDLQITDEQKQILMRAVNETLIDPFSIP